MLGNMNLVTGLLAAPHSTPHAVEYNYMQLQCFQLSDIIGLSERIESPNFVGIVNFRFQIIGQNFNASVHVGFQ